MEKLNVKCSSCNEGKVLFLVCNVIEEGEYLLGCDTCSNKFTTDDDGYNDIMDAHEYNEQVNDDLLLLHENGTWMFLVQFEKNFSLEQYTSKMNLIQSIEAGTKVNNYYTFEESILNVVEDLENGKISTHLFLPSREARPMIMAHFFGATV